MRNSSFLTLLILFVLFACNKDEDPIIEFVQGKNRFTTVVDGDVREYYVHVPSDYNENILMPVVFMLHGASGNGEITYRNSGWKKVGDDENILTVFPSSWTYCWIGNNGVQKDTSRWNSIPGHFEFCTGETPRDDVKFLRQAITDLQAKFNIDSKRIYMAGFSSGAQMTFRCAVEMSNILAAGVQSGGTYQFDTIFSPDRNIALAVELGNEDPSFFKNGYPPLSLFDTLLNNHSLFQNIIKVHTNSFAYETDYELTGDTSVAMTATFPSIPNSDNREFSFTLINGLDHSYPNGSNSPFKGAKQHWNWMKQFSLP